MQTPLTTIPDLSFAAEALRNARSPGLIQRIVTDTLSAQPRAAAAIPALAWPLLDALRATAGPPVGAALLQQLGDWLTEWEQKFGLLGAHPERATVAGEALLVQDLHYLADLHNHAGLHEAARPWSRRGHDVEAALHRTFWRGECYADSATVPGDAVHAARNLLPLLLLDTPPDRVALLAARSPEICRAALAAGAADTVLAVCEGLRRHGRTAEKNAILPLLF